VGEPAITPWPGREPPSRAALEAALRGEGLSPSWWSNAPGDTYGRHSHTYHKVLYCARGSIRFAVGPAQEAFALAAGDRLDLPPGTEHSAVVGPAGVSCVEAARA
jgi:quercetin dioxygenase-like cupin family protein